MELGEDIYKDEWRNEGSGWRGRIQEEERLYMRETELWEREGMNLLHEKKHKVIWIQE